MAVGQTETLELPAYPAASRTRQEHEKLRQSKPCAHGDQDVRSLDRLRLEAGAEADAVLLKRADDESSFGKLQFRARHAADVVVDEREALEIHTDWDAEHLRRLHTRREHELLHLTVRHLRAVDAGRMLPQRVV